MKLPNFSRLSNFIRSNIKIHRLVFHHNMTVSPCFLRRDITTKIMHVYLLPTICAQNSKLWTRHKFPQYSLLMTGFSWIPCAGLKCLSFKLTSFFCNIFNRSQHRELNETTPTFWGILNQNQALSRIIYASIKNIVSRV